jgi:hypothetical protein
MLEELLDQIEALTDKAQALWEAEQAAEDDDYEPIDEERLWPTLERSRHGVGYLCGYRVQVDEATDWAFCMGGLTRLAAAKALLDKMTT